MSRVLLANGHGQGLLDCEGDVAANDLASRVVDVNDGLRNLIWCVDIFLKLCRHRGMSLGEAATAVHVCLLCLLIARLECNRVLAHHENLLALETFFCAFKGGLQRVLDLAFATTFIVGLEKQGRWNIVRQVKLKRQNVLAWCNGAVKLPEVLLHVDEAVLRLQNFAVFDSSVSHPFFLSNYNWAFGFLRNFIVQSSSNIVHIIFHPISNFVQAILKLI